MRAAAPPFASVRAGDTVHVDLAGRSVAFRLAAAPDVDAAGPAAISHGAAGATGPAEVVAPMPGAVLTVHVAAGQAVAGRRPDRHARGDEDGARRRRASRRPSCGGPRQAADQVTRGQRACGHRSLTATRSRYAPTCSGRRFHGPSTRAPSPGDADRRSRRPARSCWRCTRETRKRRNAAAHGSPEHVAAIDLLGRIEVEDRPHRAGDGPAARLDRVPTRPDLRGRAARRSAERGDADRHGNQGALH